MEERLYLHIPALEELTYREKIMSDPATMSYNKGYDLSFEGYHKETGCIDFPREQWKDWHDYYIGQEPERYYAYVVRKEDDEYIGEVNVHKRADGEIYDMGIVLEAKYRGLGYGEEALKLLLQHAFDKMNAEEIHNDFEDTRDAAVKTHLACGLKECKRENGLLELVITDEEYREFLMELKAYE